MIKILRGERQPFRFATFDLEWFPDTHAIRVLGFYDGAEYRFFSPEHASSPASVPDFLHCLLSPRYSGCRFFAHYGGRFDLLFLLAPLLECGFSIEMAMSGSAVIRATVGDGRHKWHFCDSQFLFKTSLKKLGKAVGLEKLECAFDAPLDQLVEYNRRDCKILYRALKWADDLVRDLGGELRATLASTAMSLFRRAYLRQNIPTSPTLNAEIRGGYVSARIEKIRTRSPAGRYSDITSSFPFSMTSPLPGAHVATNRHDGDWAVCLAEVEVPDCYLPPLPIRVPKRGCFFPIGRWVGWYTSIDLRLLEHCGGRILRILKAYHFSPFTDLRAYMLDVHKIRSGETDEFRRYFLKILMNALYGKFSEREVKERLVKDPSHTSCWHDGAHLDESGRSSCIRKVRPGVFAIRERVDVPHAHVPIPMFTTANSRQLLHDYGTRATDLAYWDCDGILAKTGFPDSGDLGGMKLECEYVDAHMIAPKAYAFRAIGGSGAMQEVKDAPAGELIDIVKFKGFPRLTRDEFEALARGEGKQVEQFRAVKTALRPGANDPRAVRIGSDRWMKFISHACGVCGAYIRESSELGDPLGGCAAHGRTDVVPKSALRPKRCDEGDNDSRPWKYSEILAKYV